MGMPPFEHTAWLNRNKPAAFLNVWGKTGTIKSNFFRSAVLPLGPCACRAPRQQIPMVSRAFGDLGHVVGQQVAFFHKRSRRFLDQLQILLTRRITFLYREAGITCLLAFRLRRREWDVSSNQRDHLLGSTD